MGALIGAIAGASKIPPHLVDGLHAREEIAREIDNFVGIAIAKIKAQRHL